MHFPQVKDNGVDSHTAERQNDCGNEKERVNNEKSLQRQGREGIDIGLEAKWKEIKKIGKVDT